MKTTLKKTLLAALPLVGLLLTAPAAFAHEHHHWHRHWENRGHCQTDYGRGWRDRQRYNENYQSGWYGGQRYSDRNGDYRSRYPQQPYYSYSPWWQSFYR
ncbi:MAG: hypothetical protein HY268_34710 [Deltaproteobacteria bacterium]|nr:hypothetical protein [Deltaproteobacteria bacterium]